MPLSDLVERTMQRKNTLAYIQAAYVDIALQRRLPYKNERGGTDYQPITLPVQRFRILSGYVGRRINQNQPANPSLVEVPFSKDVLMGRWDADVLNGDVFVLGSVEYKVAFVFLNNREYETLANLSSLVAGPANG